MARFAVCIPVLNGAAFLGQALDSVARQSLKDVQVIVSDNASTDGTSDILDQWESQLDMKRLRQGKTLPLREHFNALLDEVDSEAHMLLCHDDYLNDPSALQSAFDVLNQNPNVSAVYSDLIYVNERRRLLASRAFGRRGSFSAEAAGRRTLRTVRNCFGVPLAIRRSSLGDLRYDSRFLYTMDVDLSWAVSEKSPAWHIPAPLIANRYSGQNSTWSMLDNTRHEYLALAEKYGVELNGFSRAALAATCFKVAQQKRAFGAYERLTSRLWS